MTAQGVKIDVTNIVPTASAAISGQIVGGTDGSPQHAGGGASFAGPRGRHDPIAGEEP
jgi:hypothetical protein